MSRVGWGSNAFAESRKGGPPFICASGTRRRTISSGWMGSLGSTVESECKDTPWHCNRRNRTSACELLAVEQLVVAEEQLGDGAVGFDPIGDGERPRAEFKADLPAAPERNALEV